MITAHEGMKVRRNMGMFSILSDNLDEVGRVVGMTSPFVVIVAWPKSGTLQQHPLELVAVDS